MRDGVNVDVSQARPATAMMGRVMVWPGLFLFRRAGLRHSRVESLWVVLALPVLYWHTWPKGELHDVLNYT